MTDCDKKFLQIIPAAGWYAVFRGEDGTVVVPLVSWAIVEYDCPEMEPGLSPWTEVTGLVTSFRSDVIQPANVLDNFVGYHHDELVEFV